MGMCGDSHVRYNVMEAEFDDALGTIGGGNHFAELMQVSVTRVRAVATCMSIPSSSSCVCGHVVTGGGFV